MIKYSFYFRNPEIAGWSACDELALAKVSAQNNFQHWFQPRIH
jgi:hypothetical protein